MSAAYDTIGRLYRDNRNPDPRIAAALNRNIGRAHRIVNIGAGTGSYEPTERDVVAVEPSAVMIAQRPKDASPVIQASAEQLPFQDGSFNLAMAILTIHHWSDPAKGGGGSGTSGQWPGYVVVLDRISAGFLVDRLFP